jgi:transketolase
MGVSLRMISFPSWELFQAQDAAYLQDILLPGVKKRLALEAGIRLGWDRWVGDEGKVISLDEFGASAPAKQLFEKFGFSADKVVEEASHMLGLES